ncbi:MAG: chemotaxis protein CheW [bacterium]
MVENRLIAFTATQRGFAVPLVEVREVIDVGRIESIPGSIPPLEGLAIYRKDKILPVFSLNQLLGGDERGEGDFLLVVRVGSESLGIRVMKIGKVTGYPSDDHISRYEGAPDVPDGAVLGKFQEKGEEFLILDLDRLFSELAEKLEGIFQDPEGRSLGTSPWGEELT